MLESHGLFTWGDDARSCYDTTIDVINRAIEWLDERTAGKPAFGGARHRSLEPGERRQVAAALMPAIRGMVSKDVRMVGHFDDQDAVLDFVNAADMPPLAALGTSCPDHFLRTKIRPLVVDFDPARPDLDATLAGLPAAVEAYRKDYAAYYERCRRPDSPALRDPNAVVYLVPGVGMITFARDKATARISAEFYVNAINVMRGASRRLRIPRPPRAGGLRHRVLAAGGGQAPAHAEAEEPRRPHRAASPAAPAASARRSPSATSAKAPASCSPTSTPARSPRPPPTSPRATRPTSCAPSR